RLGVDVVAPAHVVPAALGPERTVGEDDGVDRFAVGRDGRNRLACGIRGALQRPAADLGQGVGARRRLRLGAQGAQEPLPGATVDRVAQALLFLPDRLARAAADDAVDLADVVAA